MERERDVFTLRMPGGGNEGDAGMRSDTSGIT